MGWEPIQKGSRPFTPPPLKIFRVKDAVTLKRVSGGKDWVMVILEEFRAGRYGIPFSCADELPACCFRCWYLIHEESQVCYCDAPFYYYCCYSWPDKLTQSTPPCLIEAEDRDTTRS